MNLELNYIGLEYNWLFYLAVGAILQHILTALLVRDNAVSKYKTSIHKVSELQQENLHFDRYISYVSDNFYWFWNIFPIIFFAHFFYMELSWSSWMSNLFLLDINKEIVNTYEYMFYSRDAEILDIIVLTLVLCLAIYGGVIIQNAKHKTMIQNKTELYWWSRTLNPIIFYLRQFFLVTNLTLIGYLTYIITKISAFLTSVLLIDDLNIFPFHVDGYSGLHFMMEIVSILLAMYLLRASMGIIGLNDHKGQGFMHQLGDWLNIFYLPLGIALFSILVYNVKRHMDIAYEKFDIAGYLNQDTFNNFIQTFKTTTDKSSAINSFNDYYAILNFNSFPIDITMFYNTIFAAVMPISVWFLMDNFKGQIIDEIEDQVDVNEKG